MKVNFIRGFDSEQIIDLLRQKQIDGMEDFVNNLSESIDKLSQFVQKNITISDNVDQITKTIAVKHATSIFMAQPSERKKVKSIIPMQTSGFDNPISSFSWRYDLNGKIEIKVWFLGSPASPQNVTLSFFH